MTSRQPTHAMRQLWEELRQLGISEEDMPSARTLENWQAEGLIETQREWPGRGQGSRSSYTPGTAQKVLDLIDYLTADRSFDRARIVLFYRGYEINETALRQSYTNVYAELIRLLRQLETEDRLVKDLTERHKGASVRQRLRRSMDDKEEGERESVSAVGSSIAHNLRALLVGELVTEEGAAETLEGLGLAPNVWEEVSSQDRDMFIDNLDLDYAVERISTLSMDQLRELRTTLRVFGNAIDHQLTTGADSDIDLTSLEPSELTLALLVPLLPLFTSTDHNP